MKICSTTYSSPLGAIVIDSEGEMLTGLRFVETPAANYMNSEMKSRNGEAVKPIIHEAILWLDDYFVGKEPRNVPQVNPAGTDFQQKVWNALLSIPYGQTRTYGEVAKMVGCRSAQAVGQAVGSNPIAIIIPCHRVVGARGTIGGYAFGIERKRRLLELEK